MESGSFEDDFPIEMLRFHCYVSLLLGTSNLHPRKLTYPLKNHYFSREYIFQPWIFRCYVSFREGISPCTNYFEKPREPLSALIRRRLDATGTDAEVKPRASVQGESLWADDPCMYIYTYIYIPSGTLQGTNISPKNGILKMMFLFPRWDMLVPWRVYIFSWWFQIFFMFTPIWGNDPIWLTFFRWVETTN